jgi:hypothetical protein
MRLKPIQSLLLIVFGVCFLAATGWTIATEVAQPWKRFQMEFKSSEKKLLLEKQCELEDQKKKAAPSTIKQLDLQAEQVERQIKLNRKRTVNIDQVWIESLRRADRCQTCHGGMEKALFAQSKGALAKHPADFLKTHPAKTFGCTLCHDGDGLGLTVSTGHGRAAHWNRPLLSGALVQSACRRCHTYNEQIPEHIAFPRAPFLSRGKNLYLAKGCRGCHELAGVERPSSIAPVLSRVGEKVNGSWLARWLKRPKDYLPDTIMPFFDLSPEEIAALQSFLLHRQGKSPAADTTAGPADAAEGQKLFGQMGCLGSGRIRFLPPPNSYAMKPGRLKRYSRSACNAITPTKKVAIKERDAIKGPPLWFAASKFKADWLEAWLAAPEPIYGVKWGTLEKGASDHPAVDAAEAKQLTQYLMTLADAQVKVGATPPLPKSRGQRLSMLGRTAELFEKQQGCYACHRYLNKRSR